MGYKLDGTMMEMCSCNVLCPCWVGHDPDGGTCDNSIAWHFDDGEIDGTDVSGLTLALVGHIPGNPFDGNWRAVVLVDDAASAQQEQAILRVFTGQAGGPVADLAALIGEVLDVRRVPIEFEVDQGDGRFRAGDVIDVEVEALVGATGRKTGLSDTAFSSVPGAPGVAAKTLRFTARVPEHGIDYDFPGRNAVHAPFHYATS